MECHLGVHVFTQDGLWKGYGMCAPVTQRCHLQVLNLFGFKFLHVIFKACGGPQTFNFSFLEGGFKLFREGHTII